MDLDSDDITFNTGKYLLTIPTPHSIITRNNAIKLNLAQLFSVENAKQCHKMLFFYFAFITELLQYQKQYRNS
jgi:hypothetical protein